MSVTIEFQRGLQSFFQFRTLRQFLVFARKYAGVGPYATSLGLEGVLLALIYKVGLGVDTRASYLLVKMGAIIVNGHKQRNPYKVLGVGDAFYVAPVAVKPLVKYLNWRLERKKRRELFFGPPGFIFADYRILYFGIARMPYRFERISPNTHPFIGMEPHLFTGARRAGILANK